MKSVTLHISVNWHPNTSLSILQQGLAGNGPEHKFSVTQSSLYLGHCSSFPILSIGRARVPSPEEGNLKTLHLKHSPQGSWRIRKETLLPFPSHHTTSQHPNRGRAFYYPPMENPPEISWFHSRLKLFCFGLLACVFS